MKTNIIKALFGLILTFSISGLYAQSPRIKLNQIVKDTISGSVLISNLSDSNMVYSRNFYIGSDTSLVFFGTTIVAGGGGGGSFVTLPQLTDSLALYATKVQLSDSMATVLKQVATDLTLTGTGTDASPLKVDTSVIATVSALRDSLAGIISLVSTDITLTGDGSVGNPLKVDTTTYIATKGDLDLYYLASNPNGYTSDTGTVTSVAATAGTGISISGSPITGAGTLTITNTAPDQTVSISGAGINSVSGTYPSFTITGTEVDGSTTNELQTISYNSGTNTLSLSDGGGSADLSNLALVDSTRINATGDTAYYYQNGVLIGTGAIAGGGGGTTYNNISETVDTVFISDYLNVDTATLYVDAVENRVGIGTNNPSAKLNVVGNVIVDDSTFVVNAVNNRVGIGVSNPTQKLQINAPVSGVGDRSQIKITDGNLGYFQVNDGASAASIYLPTFSGLSGGINGYGGQFSFGIPSYTQDVLDNSSAITLFQSYVNESPLFLSNQNVFMFRNWTTPVFTIEADGEIRFDEYGAITDLRLDANGKLYDGASDERLKNSINDINFGLNEVMLLKPKEFWRNNEKQNYDLKEMGFIAQDVRSIIPNAVVNSKSGYFQLRTDAILATSIKAIQEQQAIIETQATEIEQLKTQIQLILTEIEQIKNK